MDLIHYLSGDVMGADTGLEHFGTAPRVGNSVSETR
jgi:hypothetical protein